ncbi:unnamed protein product, partial [Timema podura]|nr:unnamed protein product [Timema podura]
MFQNISSSTSSSLSTTAQLQDGDIVGADLGPLGTRRGQFNYHAAILSDEEYFCSGALVSTRWLLTTGQCAAGKESYVVYLGGKNLKVSETKRVTVVTRRSIIHPQFELLGLKHDVALIDLHAPVSISVTVLPLQVMLSSTSSKVPVVSGYVFQLWVGVVTLPLKELEDVTYTDQNMLLTAWGGHHVRLQDRVQYFLNTSLVSAEECSRVYVDRIQSNHICAVMAWETDSCF